MADLSDAAANAILNAEPTLYVALSSTLPTLGGGSLTEPVAADYVRPLLNLATAASRQRVTNALLDFVSGGVVTVSAAGNFGFYALMTSATVGAGTLRWRGTLSAPIAWVAGVNIRIGSGNLTIRFPNV